MMEPQVEDDAIVGTRFSFMIQAIQGAIPDGTLKDFAKLKTDGEKFNFAWKLKAIHEVLDLEKEYDKKSSKRAKKYREKGNEYFQRKSYLTALKEYNRAILLAPVFGCEEPESEISEKPADNVSQEEITAQNTDAKANIEMNGGDQATSGKEEGLDVSAISQKNEETATLGKEADAVVNNSTDKATNATVSEANIKSEGTNESEKEEIKNELALAFGNRSAALLHLKRYGECLADIQLALDFQYPQDIQHKLFERRAKCYMEINSTKRALKAFEEAKDAACKSGLKEKVVKTLMDSFAKQMEICRQYLELNKTSGDKELVDVSGESSRRVNIPQLSGNPDSRYSCMSDTVEIKQTKFLGRHVVSKEKIKAGDVLMTEEPFVSVLFTDHHKTHCYHCFAPVTIPIPCTQCSTIMFCSSACRDDSWNKFHQYECSYFAILDQGMCGRIGQLALRLVMMMGIKEVLKQVKNYQQGVDSSSVVDTESSEPYKGDYYDIYHKLVTNSRQRKVEDSFNMTLISCFLMKTLVLTGYPLNVSPDSEDFFNLGEAILRHLHIIQCNAWPIIELTKPDKFDDMKPVELGIALYPTAAFINNSCDPNSELIFYDDVLVLRAIRSISQSEQICIAYGPIFFETKLTPRQKDLKKTHVFTCRCAACEEAWPILAEMYEIPSYLCTECGLLLDSTERIENKYYKCTKCEHKQDMEEVVGCLQNSFDTFAEAMTDALSGRPEDALPKFIQHQLLLQRYLRHPWRDLAACHSAVRNCYRLQGNVIE